MKNKQNKFNRLLSDKLRLFLTISFGIFLFILFFQPFHIERFNFNDRLLFVGGFAFIVFIFLVFKRIVDLLLSGTLHNSEHGTVVSRAGEVFFMALCTVSFSFYLRYVGAIKLSFFTIFKAFLISIAPVVSVRLYDTFLVLKEQIRSLISEKKDLQNTIEKYEEDSLNKTIEFISDNSTENLSLLIAEVILIKSADNYVEIVYHEGEILKKKLIRNTLKNIELQLKPYTNFIRCHRTYIINTHYAGQLQSSYGNNWLTIKGYENKVPVSRQYLLKVKEIL